MLLYEPPNPLYPILLIAGFMTVVAFLLYFFREKSKTPPDTVYNYEASETNPQINEQIQYNAYLRTLAPSPQSIAYNIHAEQQRKDKTKK